MRTVEIHGVEIAYSDVGQGVPLLCLHGGMGIDGRVLRVPGILDLTRRGVRVLIPDQRGHGRSSRSAAPILTHAIWASDVRYLAKSIGLSRFALLGHSYGGFIALEYAVRWPDSVTHLVLVGTSAGPVSARAAAVSTDEDVREHFREAWPQFFAGKDKHWDLFGELEFSADPYRAAFERELPRYDLRDRLKVLGMPTLLIVGARDPYLSHMQWIAENSCATLLVLENVGHFPFLEAPTEFGERVASFLSQ